MVQSTVLVASCDNGSTAMAIFRLVMMVWRERRRTREIERRELKWLKCRQKWSDCGLCIRRRTLKFRFHSSLLF
jgi:hypothetical protein